MKTLLVILNSVAVTATLSLSMLANSQDIRSKPPVLRIGQKVMLPCRNSGSHQDVAKDPTITNTTSKTLQRGAKVSWSASDGDKGVITLESDIAPNGTFRAYGAPRQNYSCEAWTLQ